MADSARARPSVPLLHRLRRGATGWMLSPSLGFLLFFFVLPTVVFFVYSFLVSRYYRVESLFTWDNYYRTFTTSVYLDAMLNSLEIGLIAGVATTLIGYPFAYFLTFRLKRGRNLVLFLVVISLLGSYLVRVYAWRTILGKTGVINSFLLMIGVIKEPLLFLLFSRLAIMLTLVHVFLPFAILPIMSSLQNIPWELVEAARDLGCSPLQAFLKVTLPLSITGVLSGFGYTFVLSAADYITPQLVGGTSGAMIGLSITNQFVKVGNMGLGSSLSFVFLAVLILTFLAIRYLARSAGLVAETGE
jgi:spermidine/putrescine transport system permease protein